jgi:hypothetical protein
MGNESCPQNGKIIKLRALWLFGHNELENLGRQFACQPLRCIFFSLSPKSATPFIAMNSHFFPNASSAAIYTAYITANPFNTPTNGGGSDSVSPASPSEIPKNNDGAALLLSHPDSANAIWDSIPIAALKIQAPLTPTTRNFVTGLLVETNGAMQDKGRGIFVHNLGASDGIYVQNDGSGGTGLAVLSSKSAANATGIVVGTTMPNQSGIVVRQETSIIPTAQSETLLQLSAEGALTEMMRLGSHLPLQTGIIARLFGTNSRVLVSKDSSDHDTIVLWADGRAQFGNTVWIGSPSQPAGITLYDDADGTPYCIRMHASHLISTAGVCPL